MAIIPKGGGGKPEEEKTVTAGTSATEVLPSSGKTIKKLTVNPTPTEEKTVTPTTSQQTVSPSNGKHLAKVIVKAIQTEDKTITAGTEQIAVTPSSGKYIKNVTVNPTPSQSKTVTPSTSQQTVSPDSGKLLSQVIVEAMEDVTPEVTAQTPIITQIAENLGVTITTPSGSNKQILQGNNENLQSINQNITPKDAETIIPGTSEQLIPAKTFLRGDLTILGDSDLVPDNIPRDVNIFGVQGTRQPDYGTNVWRKSDIRVQTCRVYATIQSWSKWGGIVFKINLDGDASIFTFDSLVGKELGRYINPNNTIDIYAHVVSSKTISTRKTYKDGTYQSDYSDDAEWDDNALTYTVKIGGLNSQPNVYNLMDFTITKETELSATFIVNDDPSAYPNGGTQDGYWYEKVKDELPIGLMTDYAIDKFTVSSKTTVMDIPYSLGKLPRAVILVKDSYPTTTTDTVVYLLGVTDGTTTNMYYYYRARRNTESTYTGGNSYFIASDKKLSYNISSRYLEGSYTLLTMA